MVKTAAGILAGGKSSRMGKNKASLTWNGDTFLHTLIDACRDFPEIYVSVDDREKYRDLSCTLVEDEEKEYGPLEGIYQVLKQMDAPYAVMLATDMPMISREFLKALVSNITGEEDCLVLRREGRPQPLCSVYAKKDSACCGAYAQKPGAQARTFVSAGQYTVSGFGGAGIRRGGHCKCKYV